MTTQSDSRVLDKTCSTCNERGRGTYAVRGRCGNCGTEYRLVLSRGHDKPGSFLGAECEVCGCRKVGGHELLGAS